VHVRTRPTNLAILWAILFWSSSKASLALSRAGASPPAAVAPHAWQLVIGETAGVACCSCAYRILFFPPRRRAACELYVYHVRSIWVEYRSCRGRWWALGFGFSPVQTQCNASSSSFPTTQRSPSGPYLFTQYVDVLMRPVWFIGPFMDRSRRTTCPFYIFS